MTDEHRYPPAPLPDIMYDKRTLIELARDEYAAGRLSLADLEYHVGQAISGGKLSKLTPWRLSQHGRATDRPNNEPGTPLFTPPGRVTTP